jgi:hypothetical protein
MDGIRKQPRVSFEVAECNSSYNSLELYLVLKLVTILSIPPRDQRRYVFGVEFILCDHTRRLVTADHRRFTAAWITANVYKAYVRIMDDLPLFVPSL